MSREPRLHLRVLVQSTLVPQALSETRKRPPFRSAFTLPSNGAHFSFQNFLLHSIATRSSVFFPDVEDRRRLLGHKLDAIGTVHGLSRITTTPLVAAITLVVTLPVVDRFVEIPAATSDLHEERNEDEFGRPGVLARVRADGRTRAQ